jgi:dihydropteroate synthase
LNERGRGVPSAWHDGSRADPPAALLCSRAESTDSTPGSRAQVPMRRACAIWGVLNITPDSFSDGGHFLAKSPALERAQRMLDEGADVLDVGGESSRPAGKTYGAGFSAVSVDEELARVLPLVEALVPRGVRVSVDTVKPEVARRALSAGAVIINDVSCGRSEELLGAVAGAPGAELVLMHTRGRGECHGDNVRYLDVAAEVRDELMLALERAERCGVARERVWLDPGIGFAKTASQSLRLLSRIDVLLATHQRVLVGPSRKSFIAELAKDPSGEQPPAGRRLGGTAAAVTLAALGGAHAVRVHDVAEMRQAVGLALAARAEADLQHGGGR